MEQKAAVQELMSATLTTNLQGSDVWPYACGGMIGGGGGTFADFYAGASGVGPVDGRVVSKFEMWAGGWQIRGIRITLTDGTQGLFGSSDGEYNYYDFKPGELIQNLSLWGNGAGTRTGWVKFTTNTGGVFDHGMTDWGKKTEYPMNVYSGVFCGLSLRSGSDIDALGFVFFQPLSSIVISNVSYPNLANYDSIIQPDTIFAYSNANTGDQDRTWTWSDSTTEEDQQTFSFSKELQLSQSVTVSAGIPGIVDVSSTFSWGVNQTTTETTSSTVTTTFSVSESGVLKPGESVKLAAIAQKGTLVNIAYTGNITFTLKAGGSYTCPYSGVFSGVEYSGIVIKDLEADKIIGTGRMVQSVK